MFTKPKIKSILPDGFTVRPVQLDDTKEITDLVNLCAVAQTGKPETDENEMRNFWTMPKYDKATSTILVMAPNGKIVAYGDVDDTSSMPVQPTIWGRVHPDYEGLGIGSFLMRWGEETLRRVLPKVPADIRVAVRCYTISTHEPTSKLFTDHHFQLIRHMWQMQIDLDQDLPQPQWPPGITITTLADFQNLPAVVAAADEGFKDHWGYVAQPLDEQIEQWRHWVENDNDHDPTLWFLAMDGDEIAAVSLCSPFSKDDREMGWVNSLTVRRLWCGGGVGWGWPFCNTASMNSNSAVKSESVWA